MPQILIVIIALILSVFFNTSIFAQNAEQKTADLIAALGKTKYKNKEKKNFSFESYIDVKSEAVVKNNIQDYSGVYQSPEANCQLELRVSSDSKVEGSGYDFDFDGSRKQNFTLRDARIEGALLTATKVFADGRTKKLEAVFNNRTVTEGKNPNEINCRQTKYGLGFVDAGKFGNVITTSRFFLEYQP